VVGRGRALVDGAESADPFAPQGGRHGCEVAFGVVALTSGQDGPGLAEAV
jgi:hypothetical protein